jgi:hypothetical protein
MAGAVGLVPDFSGPPRKPENDGENVVVNSPWRLGA